MGVISARLKSCPDTKLCLGYINSELGLTVHGTPFTRPASPPLRALTPSRCPHPPAVSARSHSGSPPRQETRSRHQGHAVVRGDLRECVRQDTRSIRDLRKAPCSARS